MEALWDRGPLGVDEITGVVAGPQAWGPATVRTLINRLRKRKAIRSERVAGRVRYVALLQRADYLQAESQTLLDRLFDGRLSPLVAHFAEQRALSPDEVKTLKALIGKLDEDG